MKLRKTISMALAAIVLSGAAHAATTIGWTEGLRPQVAGTSLVSPTDANNAPPGFNLGTLGGGGGTIDIYGRIVRNVDVYEFTSNRAFRVDWIFGGFDLEGGGSTAVSGFTSRPFGSAGSVSSIWLNGVGANGNNFSTDITGGDSTIYGRQAAGTYTFAIDGLNEDDALYDIRITAVPLPAGGVLLLSALGGLGFAARRRRK